MVKMNKGKGKEKKKGLIRMTSKNRLNNELQDHRAIRTI